MWEVEERQSGVIVARFDRPPMNYYANDDVQQFARLLAEWTQRQVPAVVLAGARPGKFITHRDIEDILETMSSEKQRPVEGPFRWRFTHEISLNMNMAPMPIIVAMTGDAMGHGMELSLSCDLRVAERGDYRYGLIETQLGIVPGSTGLTRMARMIGPGKAMLLGVAGRAMTPQEAHDHGLVELLEDDALAAAIDQAERFATLPRTAVAMAKRLVYQSQGVPFTTALDHEVDCSFRAKQAPDAEPAMREYLAQPLEARREWFERPRP